MNNVLINPLLHFISHLSILVCSTQPLLKIIPIILSFLLTFFVISHTIITFWIFYNYYTLKNTRVPIYETTTTTTSWFDYFGLRLQAILIAILHSNSSNYLWRATCAHHNIRMFREKYIIKRNTTMNCNIISERYIEPS